MKTLALTALALVLVTAAGCASSTSGKPVANGAATADQKKAMLEQVMSLAGTWESPDEKGEWGTGTVMSVSSGGSAVREVMFPGAPHEMTNVYHMDGGSLIMTHYCAQGNQPRLRCTNAKPGELTFTSDSVTNMASPSEQYMGSMTLVITDKNNFEQRWKTHNATAEHSSELVLKFRRKA